MMLCLQIFARRKHDLIKKYSFSSGSWQPEERHRQPQPCRLSTLQDASDRGFRQDFEAKSLKSHLKDTESNWVHLQPGFRAPAMHARSFRKHPHWNFIRPILWLRQDCCHLWGVSWDWVCVLEMKLWKPLLLFGLQTSSHTSYFSHTSSAEWLSAMDMIIIPCWLRAKICKTNIC